MELAFSAIGISMNCIGQACCWYYIFNCCGCMDNERHVNIERQAIRLPQSIQPMQSNNPFVNSNIPRDEHLQPVYI